MRASDAAATCLPVRFDDSGWETAIFIRVDGAESSHDRRALTRGSAALEVTIDSELIQHAAATLVVLRLEAATDPDDPLVAEILLAPGGRRLHFDALDLLTRQPRLSWFFGDSECNVLRSQRHPLDDTHHVEFRRLRDEAARFDSVIRMSAGYDCERALQEVAAHYRPRSSTPVGSAGA